MRSVMKHQFSQVPKAQIPRSSFDRSHGYKTAFDAGYLIPIYVDEALPGDTFNLNMSAFARMSTPIKVPMDNLFMDFFFFAIPYRLVWNNWHKFNGAQDDPGDSTSYTIPTVTAPGAGGVAENDLYDYMGIPTKINSLEFNNLHGRAYNLCWQEWFRDQNLQDSPVVDKDDGPDTYTDYVLLRRGKRHDYFTSCLPWPQKDANNEVSIPLGTTAPILGFGGTTLNTDASGAIYETDTGTFRNVSYYASTGNSRDLAMETTSGGYPLIYADLSNATAATINALREAFQLQKMYERDARGGTRYTEIIKSHFGVVSPDARLQRPEYLGGGSVPVHINSVPQTSESNTTKQGNLASYGTASANGVGFTKSFTEHCLLLGMVSVRADLTYQKGLDRMWSRQTRADFYWPALAHIGEQSVLNKEIYADGSANDDLVFGYQERYAEYRYKPSNITGVFRSNATSSLDMWHLSQEFGSLPSLDSTFIEDNPPVDRVIATPTEPHFIFDSYFNLKCARPMPVYGVPGLIDHF